MRPNRKGADIGSFLVAEPFSAAGWPRSLRGRKYSYCESVTAVHFSALFR